MAVKKGGGGATIISGGTTASLEVFIEVGSGEALVLAARANISLKEGCALTFAEREVGDNGADPAKAGGGVDASG